jgi:hypothetical protein
MNPWHATFFGLKQIPRELTAFEIEAFFTFTATRPEAGIGVIRYSSYPRRGNALRKDHRVVDGHFAGGRESRIGQYTQSRQTGQYGG